MSLDIDSNKIDFSQNITVFSLVFLSIIAIVQFFLIVEAEDYLHLVVPIFLITYSLFFLYHTIRDINFGEQIVVRKVFKSFHISQVSRISFIRWTAIVFIIINEPDRRTFGAYYDFYHEYFRIADRIVEHKIAVETKTFSIFKWLAKLIIST
jgi:hypothetical protein